MSDRLRACAAIVRDGKILMVYHAHDSRKFWTLPGGGVEPGETPEQAAVRETLEECGLAVKIIRPLFERNYSFGREHTFLAEIIGDETICIGIDPELPLDDQWIQDVCWHTLESMKDDRQVSLVIQTIDKHD